ncbi:MAG: TIGR01777 family oxidoreductase [Leptospiraceae bacterium]|nr:TIGR01777 family oxidoreductase [Leptospiraceae bacterium]
MPQKEKKVIISAASGFIGQNLSRHLTMRGYTVIGLSRSAKNNLAACDYYSAQSWLQHIDGAYAVIHLAGENVAGGRWRESVKKRLIDSRVQTTRALCDAILSAKKKPTQVILASAIGIYGDRGNETLDEQSAPGKGFLAELGEQWESASSALQKTKVNRTLFRIGVVLGNDGGFVEKLKLLMKLGLGGPPGNGNQYMSWVHLADVLSSFQFALDKNISGIYNLTAPNPVTASELFAAWGKALHRPVFLPAPAFALKMVFGQMADEVLLASARVIPKSLLKAKFNFQYPLIESAFESIVTEDKN